jgi:hypothetical protein
MNNNSNILVILSMLYLVLGCQTNNYKCETIQTIEIELGRGRIKTVILTLPFKAEDKIRSNPMCGNEMTYCKNILSQNLEIRICHTYLKDYQILLSDNKLLIKERIDKIVSEDIFHASKKYKFESKFSLIPVQIQKTDDYEKVISGFVQTTPNWNDFNKDYLYISKDEYLKIEFKSNNKDAGIEYMNNEINCIIENLK